MYMCVHIGRFRTRKKLASRRYIIYICRLFARARVALAFTVSRVCVLLAHVRIAIACDAGNIAEAAAAAVVDAATHGREHRNSNGAS